MRTCDILSCDTIVPDLATGRATRVFKAPFRYCDTPTYHIGAAFSADSRYLVFAGEDDEASGLFRAEPATGEVVALTVLPASAGGRFTGNGLAMLPRTGWVAATFGRSLRLYRLDTGEERVLIEDIGADSRISGPIGSVDGTQVICTRPPAMPAGVANGPDYFAYCVERWGGMPTTYLRVDIATGAVEEVFHEPVAGSNHVQPCPADPDLWLIDRDWPPLFSHGCDHGRTSRAWLLDARTGALTELRPRNANRFQIHTNWNPTGTRVYYHSWAGEDRRRQYIGVADVQGQVVWEHEFPGFNYGHVSTHTQTEAIITDGLITPNLITALHYEEGGADGIPRIELLAQHDTDWTVPGQYAHPHCHMSPDGRWLTYNQGFEGGSRVCVVDLG